MLRSIFRGLISLLLVSVVPASAFADLIITLTPDGSGGTNATFTGFINVSGGSNQGAAAVADLFGANLGQDRPQWIRTTTTASSSSYVNFPGAVSNPAYTVMNNAFLSNPTTGWTTAEDLFLAVNGNHNSFDIVGYDGAYNGITAINETANYPASAIPFTTWNDGVWQFGNTTDAVEGNGILFIISSAVIQNPVVPEPSTFGLTALGGFALFRRKRTSARYSGS